MDDLISKAAKYGYLSLVIYSLKKGADITKHSPQASLQWACLEGYLDIVKCLVGNIFIPSNYHSLISAIHGGQCKVVECLVENGFNIHLHENKPLRLASSTGRYEIVKCLIEKEADIRDKTDYSIRVASRNGHLKIVQYLIENGADIHAKNNYCLQWATKNRHYSVVNYIQTLF